MELYGTQAVKDDQVCAAQCPWHLLSGKHRNFKDEGYYALNDQYSNDRGDDFNGEYDDRRENRFGNDHFTGIGNDNNRHGHQSDESNNHRRDTSRDEDDYRGRDLTESFSHDSGNTRRGEKFSTNRQKRQVHGSLGLERRRNPADVKTNRRQEDNRNGNAGSRGKNNSDGNARQRSDGNEQQGRNNSFGNSNRGHEQQDENNGHGNSNHRIVVDDHLNNDPVSAGDSHQGNLEVEPQLNHEETLEKDQKLCSENDEYCEK